MKLLIEQELPTQVVANKCGVSRTTIWRWKQKWLKLNQNVQLENFNRPNRELGKTFRFAALKWKILTLSSRPHTSPKAISEDIVKLVLALRIQLKRCAEIIWFHLNQDYLVKISLDRD